MDNNETQATNAFHRMHHLVNVKKYKIIHIMILDTQLNFTQKLLAITFQK